MKKKSLLLFLGLALAIVSCTKDPIITDPTFNDNTEKPVEPTDPTEPTEPTEPGTDTGIDKNEPETIANFNNWDSFLKSLNQYGLNKIAELAPGQGREGKNAMKINGQLDKNDYVFTIENQSVSQTAKAITIYIKGTANKSLSFNVFKSDGTYDVFNLRTDAQIEAKQPITLQEDILLLKTSRMQTANPQNGNNDYTNTKIDTNNKWIRITLDISNVDYNKSKQGALFALKIGSKEDYNLLIESITFDDNIAPGEGGEPTNPDFSEYNIPAEYKDYYNTIDFTKNGMELKKQLAQLVTKTHSPLTYTPGIWNASEITDQDPDNPKNVLQIYAWPDKDVTEKNSTYKRSVAKEDKNNGTSTKPVTQLWEREHVFAKSLAVDKSKKQEALEAGTKDNTPPTAIEYIAGHDAHHLRPINRSVNSARGNKKFVDGSGNSVSKGVDMWYPGDEWRGDVARMMMYMHIRYENENGGGYTKATKVGKPIDSKNGILSDEMIDLFLKWNAEDPVSEIERKRNDFHGNKGNLGAQGNRNPFIDNPQLANQIWGMTEKYKAENTWAK